MITMKPDPQVLLDQILSYLARTHNKQASMEAALNGVQGMPNTRLLVLHKAAAEASGFPDDCVILDEWDPMTSEFTVLFSHDVMAVVVSTALRGLKEAHAPKPSRRRASHVQEQAVHA